MKKFSVILATLVLAAVVATPALAAIEVSGSVYAGVLDKYMWRGINLSSSQPVAQGGVNVSAGGFTLSYWSNVQLSNGCKDGDCPLQSDEVTETDITLDYSHDFGPVKLSVGDIYYNFNVPGNTHELYLGLTGNCLLSPTVKVYYDWDYANDIDADGLYYSVGVSHSFDLMDKLSLGLGATANYSDESPYLLSNDDVYTGWHNYELSASATYAITDQISITPSIVYSSPISDDAKEAIDSETAGGVTVTFTF
jgi:uncharacterized protein (TIGR02001 family)